MRDVDRRDHRRLVHHRSEAKQGRRQGRVRARSVQRHEKGANWLWAWALAIPAGTKNADAAQKFISWATAKDYIELVAKEGWGAVPTGTRKSTYANPEFLKAAKFADAEKKAIDSANANDSHAQASVRRRAVCGDPRVPGDRHRRRPADSSALAGKVSGRRSVEGGQIAADREMKRAGYYK